MTLQKRYVKLKSVTPVEVANTYDITVADKHLLIANGFYTSNCWHPDIIEFINAKQTPGRLTKFNISVNCTDDFMDKVTGVDTNDDWDLRFPDTTHELYKTKWQGDIKKWENEGYPVITYRTISAKWLWNLISESTYNRAEPGVLFLDRANALNPLNYVDKIVATNPCVSGDSVIKIRIDGKEQTMDMKSLDDFFHNGHYELLEVQSMNVDTGVIEFKKIENSVLTRKSAEVLKITDTETGKSLICTPDHKVWTKNRGYVAANKLEENDILEIK
jgi:ribonucleotide reductase alpha subunit